jgi:hypothetical protein
MSVIGVKNMSWDDVISFVIKVHKEGEHLWKEFGHY